MGATADGDCAGFVDEGASAAVGLLLDPQPILASNQSEVFEIPYYYRLLNDVNKSPRL